MKPIRFFDKGVQDESGWRQKLIETLNSFVARTLNSTSGTISVSEVATTGVATFEQTERNTTYRLSLTPISLTGSPTAGSSRVRSIAKTTTGFTVTVEAAPGAGTAVAFDWILHRGF